MFGNLLASELYILKRALLISSEEIQNGDKYSEEEKKTHIYMLNAVIIECRDRNKKEGETHVG